MRIELLGTRGNVPSSASGYSHHSGVLIDESILLDLGETSYLRRHPRHVFVTHLHPDHAAFMLTKRAPRVDIHLPERCSLIPAAKRIAQPVQIGEHRIVPVPTEHAANVRSVGFIVERDGRRVFYSSDMISIHRRYYRRLGCLDLVITEGSFMRRGGLIRRDPTSGKRFGHAGLPDLVRFFRRFTQRIIVTHFGSWFFRDVRSARRRIEALSDQEVTVIAGRDGMSIEL